MRSAVDKRFRVILKIEVVVCRIERRFWPVKQVQVVTDIVRIFPGPENGIIGTIQFQVQYTQLEQRSQ